MIRTAIVFIVDAPPKAAKGDIPYIYVGEPNQNDFALEWKDPTKTLHVVIPQELDPRAIKASFNPDGSFNRLVPDPAKITDIRVAAKQAQISDAYQRMDKDIFDRMELVFGTRRADSATAFQQTWQLMSDKPDLFAGKPGVIATKPAGGVVTGQPLSTTALVRQFSTACLNDAEAYAVWRVQRIAQYLAERAAIQAAP